MGKVLTGCKGAGSGTNCCCTPQVVSEWSGCQCMDDYFDQETNSLADLLGPNCIPCGSGKEECGETMGWRIIAIDRSPSCDEAGTNPCSGGCGEWDYAIKVIEKGDIVEISGECFFERCPPPTGGAMAGTGDCPDCINYFCPSGCCPDSGTRESTTFQLQFGCTDRWPDEENNAACNEYDCPVCSGSGSGGGSPSCDGLDCSEFSLTNALIQAGTVDADCDCYGQNVSLTRTDCTWGGQESQAGVSPCFGTHNVGISCVDGQWQAVVSSTSMCDAFCEENFIGNIDSDENGFPTTGVAYTLDAQLGNCGDNATITITLS